MTISPDELERLTHSPEAEIERLRRALVLTGQRLELVVRRAAACQEEHPDAHVATVRDGPLWVEEAKKALEPGARLWFP